MIYDLVVWILDQNNDAKKWHAMTSERLKQRVLPQIENSSALWSPHSATPCLLDKKIKILAVLLILSTGSMWWFSQTTVSPSLKSPAEIADLEEGSFISAHCDMEGYNMTFGEFMAQVNEITPADRGYFCKGIRSRDCGCIEPTRAQPGFSKKWFRAFDWLKEHAAGAPTPLQVAFLGDSIFDRLNGRLALQEDESMADVYEVFKELFTTDGGGQINGVSLGLAGDLVSTKHYFTLCR